MNLSDLNWPAVRNLNKDTPVVMPIAALEQHGHHLPLFTDSLLLGEIVRRLTARFEDRVLFAPLQWLGYSEHHMDFAGTLTAPSRAYLDILGGLFENMLEHGFKRLLFLNGHGGNDVPARHAILEVRQRHRHQNDVLLLSATYWHLAPEAGQAHPQLSQKHMGHACEWETSMILRIAPHLVGDIEGLTPVQSGNAFDPASRAWITKDRTQPGHIGNPRAATAEKGEALLACFTEGSAGLLERMIAWDGRAWNA